ncbi:hypothetical protein PNOK_0611900 [Pyrrhoderma noxium]|uniref:Uncharacterized protein n=1 Tax=Pyrrhoderma noxium TaxID=2282107 RepID=A0A286UDG6_9AGAM|nr:hypothetical protein PNOK_0611900 [Pyrrhoderma noxium]
MHTHHIDNARALHIFGRKSGIIFKLLILNKNHNGEDLILNTAIFLLPFLRTGSFRRFCCRVLIGYLFQDGVSELIRNRQLT